MLRVCEFLSFFISLHFQFCNARRTSLAERNENKNKTLIETQRWTT